MRAEKTSTDEFWNKRAGELDKAELVNIDDLPQRRCENAFLFKHLSADDEVLEVGCGNGFLTQDLRQRVSHVDGFDFAENMISRAKDTYGETNNKFWVGSVLDPNAASKTYDAVVCVRVLINLANVEEQVAAIRNMAKWVKPGGKLLLVEGYLDGFEVLNALRGECRLDAMKPAAINFYSHVADLRPAVEESFEISDEWSSGMFDLLTRVTYPLLVGADKATGPSDFHEKTVPLALAIDEPALAKFGRLRGFAAVKR